MKTIALMFCAYFNKLSHEGAARLLTAAVLLLGGCVVPSTTEPTASKRTGEIHMTATLLIPEVQQKSAISVGLYESPKFLNYQQPLRATGTSAEYFPLGRASAQLFDQASRTLFTTVTLVNARPPLEQGLSVDGVIEPHIEAFEITDLGALGGGSVVVGEIDVDRADPFLARIRYRFDLYDRGGAQVSSWVVIGDASMLMPTGRGTDFFAILVDAALKDAMRTFVQDFGRNPDVMQWLNSKTR
jgi:hypothetical protein